jgi:acyl carrier protein
MDELSTLQHVFRQVFQDDELAIGADANLAEIVDWNSVTHVKLVLSLEEEFGIQFSDEEISSVQTVNDFLASIKTHKKRSA